MVGKWPVHSYLSSLVVVFFILRYRDISLHLVFLVMDYTALLGSPPTGGYHPWVTTLPAGMVQRPTRNGMVGQWAMFGATHKGIWFHKMNLFQTFPREIPGNIETCRNGLWLGGEAHWEYIVEIRWDVQFPGGFPQQISRLRSMENVANLETTGHGGIWAGFGSAIYIYIIYIIYIYTHIHIYIYIHNIHDDSWTWGVHVFESENPMLWAGWPPKKDSDVWCNFGKATGRPSANCLALLFRIWHSLIL